MSTTVHCLSHGSRAARMGRFIALPLLLAWVGVSVSRAEDTAKDQPKSAFRTREVKRGTVAQTVRATGTLEPEDVVDVGPQVAGQVVKLTVDYGAKVEAGAVLAQLDDRLYRARVDKAQARVQLARANLKLQEAELVAAERDFARAEKSATISAEDYDSIKQKVAAAKARAEVTRAGVAEAEAALKEAEINLGYTTICSPIAGVIIDRRVNAGQTVATGLNVPSLFLIAKDLKRMQVWAAVNEADVGQVRVGQRATFSVSAHPDVTFEGKVTQLRLNAAIKKNVVTYTVVVDVDNAGGKLLPSMTADVKLVGGERKDVLLVPNAALKWRPRPEQVASDFRAKFEEEPRQPGVVWVEDKGHVRPVKLRLGVTDGAVTEVVEGDLKEGTAVVVGSSTADPKPGVRVIPR